MSNILAVLHSLFFLLRAFNIGNSMNRENTMSNIWTELEEIPINGGTPLALYQSKRSKLLVVVADVPGPTVNGCMSFVTETDSDDGLPHTLEHLVFMGSKRYPYKGILDVIANRCLASGTNAWTAQDYTAYTLSTIGSEGFLKILPVYMDHVLSPTLTAAQFATEVHHINGEGEDAGVVYCEMQDSESTMSSIVLRKTKEVMYSKGNPYRIETGGRLENLRESCSIEKVRSFHQKYYHLSNMMIIVTGKIDHQKLLSVIEGVEEEQLSKIPSSFPSPFNLSISPLTESSVHTVTCPSDDESRGSVDITWLGPPAGEISTITALNVLLKYLSYTPVSPIHKDFITTDPIASSVDYLVKEQVISSINLAFRGVPTAHLEEIRLRFFNKTIRNLLEEKEWDMERMGFVIETFIKDGLLQMETDPRLLFRQVIGFQVYDNFNMETLKNRVNLIDVLKKLRSEPASFWVKLMDKYLNSSYVVVIGKPNKELVDKMAEQEQNRIESQQEKLGKDGLEIQANLTADAIRENSENKPTAELLEQLIVKNLEEFSRVSVVTTSNVANFSEASPSSAESEFLAQFPFPVFLHNSTSKFIEMSLLFDTSDLPTDQLAWLLLYNSLTTQSPAIIDGELKSAEEVAKLATKEIMARTATTGVSREFERFLRLSMKAPVDNGYPLLAKWAKIMTTGIVYEVSRIKQAAKKLVSKAIERERNGHLVATAAMNAIMFDRNSNNHLNNYLILEKFHEKVAEMCDIEPDKVVQKLEEIREVMFKRGLNAHFICNVDLIDRSQYNPELWDWAAKAMGKTEAFQAAPGESVNASAIGTDVIIPVGGSESSFIIQNCLFDADWNSTEYLSTSLYIQYLSQTEGPLWRGIRGVGLAYAAYIDVEPDKKMISLTLYRCGQPSQAYQQSKEIVESIVSPDDIVESEFEAAKRSLVYKLMSNEETVSEAGSLAVLSVYRKSNPEYVREACQRIWNMSKEEMLTAAKPRIAKLFTDFARVIVAHPSKVSEITESFLTANISSIADFSYKM